MKRIYNLDEKTKKKLAKLKNIRIQRKIVTRHLRTSMSVKNIQLEINTNTNSFLGNVEDWLTIEGETKIGLTKTYYYSLYKDKFLQELKDFIKDM